MKDLILNCGLPMGDVTLLTAAVRDLHISYPGRYRTAVRSGFPEIWENNPYVTPLGKMKKGAETIECEYPLIDQSNHRPYHAISGFVEFLNAKLKVNIHPHAFKGDIRLSIEEKEWCSQVQELTGEDIPFWLVVTGGKYDVTTKWWPVERYQQVVDRFAGAIQFVQIGGKNHYHPPLKGVVDLRGKTNLRQLIRLIYHAQGVMCPVTSVMHMAAAVQTKEEGLKSRPCVVIAGGREPSQWEAYSTHQFLHVNGSLFCCDEGGCWKSRTRPLGDGSEFDRPENLCVNRAGNLPRCMDLIKADQVIRRIEMHFDGHRLDYLKPQHQRALQAALQRGESSSWNKEEMEYASYRAHSERFTQSIPPYPDKFSGRGIVICAGGETYFTNAWVCINMLRRLGCDLPVELWYRGRGELSRAMQKLVEPLGVRCVDALASFGKDAARLNGWSLKPHALLHSSFQEVLLLDADNVPAKNPEYLFETPEYRRHGAIFWPDVGKLAKERTAWKVFGVPYRDEPEFESGQILVDKKKVWKPLSLALWYNQNSDFYYQHVYGDKETYHMAFRKLDAGYAMPSTPVRVLDGAMLQYDFEGNCVFQHRNIDRWSVRIPPRPIEGFQFEKICIGYLKSLRNAWAENRDLPPSRSQKEAARLIREITGCRYDLNVLGSSRNLATFTSDGRINSTLRDREWTWKVGGKDGAKRLEIYSDGRLISRLNRTKRGRWQNEGGESVILTHLQEGKTKECVWLRSPVNSYTGYGLHAIQIVSDILRDGYEARILPQGLDEKFSAIPTRMRERITHEQDQGDWELLLHPPNIRPTPGKKTVFFTMWEASKLPPGGVEYLNEAECVIVPCRWNAERFREEGVTKPIYRIPLGIKTQIFKYTPLPLTGPCIFGAAGRLAQGGARKGINQVIQAFLTAFPSEPDARLFVKAFPDCDISLVQDPRITVVQKYLSERAMAEWYRSITCFVSAARGEGWGLMQHQALATGRPVISIAYGGITEFFNERVGYPLNYTLVPAESHYANCGVWAEISQESLIQRMREVYRDRKKAINLGIQGAREVAELSWHASNTKLLQILRQRGAIS